MKTEKKMFRLRTPHGDLEAHGTVAIVVVALLVVATVVVVLATVH